jgi:hypothetical protein
MNRCSGRLGAVGNWDRQGGGGWFSLKEHRGLLSSFVTSLCHKLLASTPRSYAIHSYVAKYDEDLTEWALETVI